MLTAGLLAGAVTAVLTLGGKVLPDSPAKLAGDVRGVELQGEQPLADFVQIVERGERASVILVSQEEAVPLAQEEQGTPESGEGPPPSEMAPPPTTETAPEALPDAEPPPVLEEQPPEAVELLDPATQPGPAVETIDLPEDGSETPPRVERRAVRALTGDPHAPDRQVRRVLAGTVLRVLPEPNVAAALGLPEAVPVSQVERVAPYAEDRLAPIGRVVDFAFKLDGFEGDAVEVHWTLFRAKTRVPVRRPWLQDRTALRLRPRSDSQGARERFWIPRPKGVPGPFFVRVELVDQDGVRLDKEDSARFR